MIKAQNYDGSKEYDIPELLDISNDNLLINGDFQVWQRGNEIVQRPGITYGSDRWAFNIVPNKTIVRRDAANGNGLILLPNGNDYGSLYQIIELTKEAKGFLINKNVTVTIVAKANRNMPVFFGFTSELKSIKLTGDFAPYSMTKKLVESDFDVNGNLRINALSTKVENKYLASDVIQLVWVKLEFGEFSTPLVPRYYAEELILCQRYFQFYRNMIMGCYDNLVKTYFAGFNFMQEMRTKPNYNMTLLRDTIGNDIINTFANLDCNSKCVRTISLNVKQIAIEVSLAVDAEIY